MTLIRRLSAPLIVSQVIPVVCEQCGHTSMFHPPLVFRADDDKASTRLSARSLNALRAAGIPIDVSREELRPWLERLRLGSLPNAVYPIRLRSFSKTSFKEVERWVNEL